MKYILWALLASSSLTGLAYADDTSVTTDPVKTDLQEQGPPPSPYGALLIGLTGTTNYLVAGHTQTGNRPAFQPFIEYDSPWGIYVGAWASTVNYGFGDPNKWEDDIYVGYRTNFGKVSIDTSYWRYYNDKSGFSSAASDNILYYNFTDKFKLGTELKFDFENPDSYSALASFTPIDTWTISGRVDFTQHTSDVDWNIGINKQFDQTFNADLRYYDSTFDHPRVVLTLNAVFDVFSMLAKK